MCKLTRGIQGCGLRLPTIPFVLETEVIWARNSCAERSHESCSKTVSCLRMLEACQFAKTTCNYCFSNVGDREIYYDRNAEMSA